MKNYAIIILCLVSIGMFSQTTPGITPTVGAFHVVNQNGATITISVQPYASVHKSDEGTIYTGWFPYIFSEISTNVDDFILIEDIRISPNPAQHEIAVQRANKGNSNWQVTLHDQNGKLLKKQTWEEHQQELKLNISPLPSGTFILMFFDPVSSKYRMEKFIKID